MLTEKHLEDVNRRGEERLQRWKREKQRKLNENRLQKRKRKLILKRLKSQQIKMKQVEDDFKYDQEKIKKDQRKEREKIKKNQRKEHKIKSKQVSRNCYLIRRFGITSKYYYKILEK